MIAAPEIRDDAPDGALVARDSCVHNRYGQSDADMICLVRPDGYIGYLTDDIPALRTALDRVMLT